MACVMTGIADLGAMGVAEAVAFSGLSRTRLFALVRDKQIASTRIGNRRLIYRSSLIEYLESQAQREQARSA